MIRNSEIRTEHSTHALCAYGASTKVAIEDCTLGGGSFGVLVVQEDAILAVVRCKVTGGEAALAGAHKGGKLQIVESEIGQCTDFGLRVEAGSELQMTGGRVYDCKLSGIGSVGQGAKAIINKVTVEGMGHDGMVADLGGMILATDCIVRECVEYALDVWPGSVIAAERCKIHGKTINEDGKLELIDTEVT